jgi:hypothetical protein
MRHGVSKPQKMQAEHWATVSFDSWHASARLVVLACLGKQRQEALRKGLEYFQQAIALYRL